MIRPMTWWMRAYLIFATVQGLGIGLTGLVLPSEMQIPLSISPLNARFIAALYAAGAIGLLFASFARYQSEARLFVLGFGLLTGMVLVLTVLHWSEFMADPLPHRPIWIFDYVADPLLALALIPLAGLLPIRGGRRHGLTLLLTIQAVIYAILGLTLLFAPEVAAVYWPWNLPVLLSQVYACFFIAFAVGALFAARETQPGPVRNFIASSLALTVLVLVASLIHLGSFRQTPSTWFWFGAFGLGTLIFAAALIQAQQMYRRGGSDAPEPAALVPERAS